MTYLDWSKTDWPEGQLVKRWRLPVQLGSDSVDVQVEVAAPQTGRLNAFNMTSPYVDAGQVQHFGSAADIGILYATDGPDTLPVQVTLLFSKPVRDLSFEISDIDGMGASKDSVVIRPDLGVTVDIMLLAAQSTVEVDGLTAYARGGSSGHARNGSAYGHDESGTIRLDFGGQEVRSVQIFYYAAVGSQSQLARGIGLFGNMSFSAGELRRADLLLFGATFDEECEAIVRWSTAWEHDLSGYSIEYSYDGDNFYEAVRVPAANLYQEAVDYEVALNRKLRKFNYYKLFRTDSYGNRQLLTGATVKGSECYRLSQVNVFPNPTDENHVFVEIDSYSSTEISISIHNHQGEQLVRTFYHLREGYNRFKLASRHLVPGVYAIRFENGDDVVTRQVVII